MNDSFNKQDLLRKSRPQVILSHFLEHDSDLEKSLTQNEFDEKYKDCSQYTKLSLTSYVNDVVKSISHLPKQEKDDELIKAHSTIEKLTRVCVKDNEDNINIVFVDYKEGE